MIFFERCKDFTTLKLAKVSKKLYWKKIYIFIDTKEKIFRRKSWFFCLISMNHYFRKFGMDKFKTLSILSLSFPFLSFPFLSFPFLSFSFLSFLPSRPFLFFCLHNNSSSYHKHFSHIVNCQHNQPIRLWFWNNTS